MKETAGQYSGLHLHKIGFATAKIFFVIISYGCLTSAPIDEFGLCEHERPFGGVSVDEVSGRSTDFHASHSPLLHT